MNVSDVMTGSVVTVGPDTTIAEAAGLMLEHRISGLPVVDGSGQVLGIVTEGDLLRRVETDTERHRQPWLEFLIGPGRLASEYIETHARKVGEVMSDDVVTIGPREPLSDAVELMEKRHVKRLPVVEEGRLVGIISRADLLRALLDVLAHPSRNEAPDRKVSDNSDEAIRTRILAEIEQQPWSSRFGVDVTVTAGAVELHGGITDERERTALRVLAENVAGVRAVTDHLVWVEPVSGVVIPAQD